MENLKTRKKPAKLKTNMEQVTNIVKDNLEETKNPEENIEQNYINNTLSSSKEKINNEPSKEDCENSNLAQRTKSKKKRFSINLEIDLLSISLFFLALLTRMYKLAEPKNIV